MENYRDFVEEFRRLYSEEIEPLIEKGEYRTAQSLLDNIVMVVKMGGDSKIFNLYEIPQVHCGLSLLGSIVGLYDRLDNPGFDKKRDTLHLRAYLAQTKLPTQEEVNTRCKLGSSERN